MNETTDTTRLGRTNSSRLVTGLRWHDQDDGFWQGEYDGVIAGSIKTRWGADGKLLMDAIITPVLTLETPADDLVMDGDVPAATKQFTVERQFLVPVFHHARVGAADGEAAMRAAMDDTNFDWEGSKEDYEGARPHYVTGCWEGGAAYPYDEKVDGIAASLPVPADISAPDDGPGEHGVDPAAGVIGAARAIVEAYGGDVPDWLQAEFRRLEVALRAYRPGKLTLADVVKALADEQKAWPSIGAVIEQARNQYEREGEIEIDEATCVSADDEAFIQSGGGAYVLAWVWAELPSEA